MRKSSAIALHQIMAWRRDYKVWAALALCLAFCIFYVSKYISFSEALTYPVQAVEAYVIIGSSVHYFTGILLGALLLLSDAPFINSRSPYEIMRVGKQTWLRGQVCYIIFSIILYSLIAIGFSVAVATFSGSIYFENTWSEAMTVLAKRQPSFAVSEFSLAFPYSNFIDVVSPYGAMLLTLFFNSCYICLLCLCMFAVNVYSSRGFGWLVAILVHIAGYVIIANGLVTFYFQRFSPLSCAFPVNQFQEFTGITSLHATVVFFILIALLIYISDRRAQSVTA